MLTDQRLTETALKLIAAELDVLATYDMSGPIGEELCSHHCTTDECGHDAAESAQEIRTVHQKVKGMVTVLRLELARYATARGITLPEPAHH